MGWHLPHLEQVVPGQSLKKVSSLAIPNLVALVPFLPTMSALMDD